MPTAMISICRDEVISFRVYGLFGVGCGGVFERLHIRETVCGMRFYFMGLGAGKVMNDGLIRPERSEQSFFIVKETGLMLNILSFHQF